MKLPLVRIVPICSLVLGILTMPCMAVGDPFEDEVTKDEAMLGGETVVPPDEISNKDPELVAGIDRAKKLLDEENWKFNMDSIRATKQVVQGFLYHVKVDAVSKRCHATCDIVKHCSFKIWSRSWLPDAEKRLVIQDFACIRKTV